MTKYLKKIIQFLNPSPPIAGVEISDFYLRFFYFKKDKLMNLDMRLTPGVVKNGKVVQEDKFNDAFKKLMHKLGKNAKKLPHIIIALPSSSVFLQTFNLPYLAPDKVSEAAKLNLQMISPIPIEDAYADWDELGEDLVGNQLTFLGVFSDRKNINTIINACRGAGFVIVAIEPAIFSLDRAARKVSSELETDEFYILLNVTNEGMDFAGVFHKKARFDYFVSWLSMYEGATEISPQVFEDTVARYTQQVLNFALSNVGVSPKEMILIASEFRDEIRSIIEKSFKIKVSPIDSFTEAKMQADWGISYGAYLRGLIPRGEDNLISLTSIRTKDEFKQSQIILFVKLWRNIVTAFGITLLIIFSASIFFLQSLLNKNQSISIQRLPENERSQLSLLRNKASKFNDIVKKAFNSQIKGKKTSSYVDEILKAATSDISITYVGLQSLSSPISLKGTGSNLDKINEFKQLLKASSLFESVDLELNSIQPIGGGRSSFSINITLRL